MHMDQLVGIVKLVETLPGRGYKLFVDNYYTSIPLARYLLEKDIYLVGTLRKDRGVPAAMKFGDAKKAKPTKKYPKGSLMVGYTADKAIFMIGFMDNAAVYFLDAVFGTSPENYVKMERKSTGSNEKTYFNVPKAIDEYNKYMGGVYQLDQI